MSPRFAARLTRAAILDAARLVGAACQYVVLDPGLCRLLGHTDQPIYDAEGTQVLRVCIRCGRGA